jgi:hypothetical protein
VTDPRIGRIWAETLGPVDRRSFDRWREAPRDHPALSAFEKGCREAGVSPEDVLERLREYGLDIRVGQSDEIEALRRRVAELEAERSR